MDYPKTKVYFDGSHFIGIPPEKQIWKKRKNNISFWIYKGKQNVKSK